jgi:hypothetical protein
MTITAVARGDGVMPGAHGEQYDFFLSRRGSVAVIAREVHDVLTERGYKVLLQDCDIPFGASFIEAMHEAVKNSRDLIILLTHDYEQSTAACRVAYLEAWAIAGNLMSV